MRRSIGNRKIKDEVCWWIQSNLEIILKLFNISFTDFAALLGTTRQSLYNILHHKDSLNGRWVLSIFMAINYVCYNQVLEGKGNAPAYEAFLNVMRPMAHYTANIDDIYED